MKKLLALICILIFATTTSTFAAEDYYATDIIKIHDKTFVGFGGSNYYDIDSFKHNKQTNTYYVTFIEDRDPSTDLGYYKPSPYDNGIITHMLFAIEYSPAKQKVEVQYKGFVSSIEKATYKDGVLHSMHDIPTHIYYDNNKKHIPELKMWLDYYNFKNIQKAHYHDEITKFIEKYIERNRNTALQNFHELREAAVKYYNIGLPLSIEDETSYITEIPNQKLEAYKKDMNKAINHLLNAPITHWNNSLTVLMQIYAKEIEEINQKYEKLEDKTEYSPIAINRLSSMGGTLDLYNVVMGEELKEICKKYKLKFPNSAHGAIIMYTYYLKKYDIELSDEFYEFWITNYITKQRCFDVRYKISNDYLWHHTNH